MELSDRRRRGIFDRGERQTETRGEKGREGALPIFLWLIDKADIWNSSPIPQRQGDGGERMERRVNSPARLSAFFFFFFPLDSALVIKRTHISLTKFSTSGN